MPQLGCDLWDPCRGSIWGTAAVARSPLWWHMPNAGTNLWRQETGTPKTSRSWQIGDSPELHSQALPPAFGSPCQALGVSRNRNWDHRKEEIYVAGCHSDLISAMVVPRELNQVQHPGVCWILGRHGRRCPCSQPEGQRGPRFGKGRHHAPSAGITERCLPGDTGSNILVFLGHSTKGEACGLGWPAKASYGSNAISCASRKLGTGTKQLCILPREQQRRWPESLAQAVGGAAASPSARRQAGSWWL